MSRVLVLSPHPDDEAIGCGGAICAHVADGDEVEVVFLTSGEHGCAGRAPEETARVREAEARAAAKILGTAGSEFWHVPDGSLRATLPLVDRLRQRFDGVDILYAPHGREQHPDHRATARLAVRACDGPDAPEVRFYEVWTPLGDMDWIIDITPHVETKREAIRAHASQCTILPFDEAALGLNRYRGEMHSWPGGPYAEVFQILR